MMMSISAFDDVSFLLAVSGAGAEVVVDTTGRCVGHGVVVPLAGHDNLGAVVVGEQRAAVGDGRGDGDGQRIGVGDGQRIVAGVAKKAGRGVVDAIVGQSRRDWRSMSSFLSSSSTSTIETLAACLCCSRSPSRVTTRACSARFSSLRPESSPSRRLIRELASRFLTSRSRTSSSF